MQFLGVARVTSLMAALWVLAGCGAKTLQPRSPGPQGIQLRHASDAGVSFAWPQQGPPPLDISQTIGAGCAFLDFNRDGWQDILLIGDPQCGLFLNDGTGKFKDGSAAAGLLQVRGPWRGVAVGDYDADNWPDLLLTGYHQSRLLKNVQGRALKDVSAAAGYRDTGWGSSAGWADLDADGDLDLVVGHYVRYGPKSQQHCSLGSGVQSGCPPSTYPAEFTRIYRNDAGRLVDVSATCGIVGTQGKTLAVGFCDYDGDRDLDIYLANDGTPGDLLTNLGGLRFRNDNFLSGTAFGSDQAAYMSGMGVDWGDYDNDGKPDLVVTNFSNFDYSLFRNEPPVFRHVSRELGLFEPTYKSLGFGERFVDLDNDGFLDLVFANGHVYDNVNEIDSTLNYRQPLIVLRNEAGKHFADISTQSGEDVKKPIVGRGLAAGDFDNDGRSDLLVVDYAGEVRLLHNETSNASHWVGVELHEPGMGRDGHGARLLLEGGGVKLLREVVTASSYLSSSDPRVLFGWPSSTPPERLTIRWMDGKEQQLPIPELDRYYTVTPKDRELRPAANRESQKPSPATPR